MKKNKAAQTLGKMGGKAKSKRKTDAARENGKKGGRPRVCHKFPKLAEWLFNEDDDSFCWRETDEQGGRLYRIYKDATHYEVDIIHHDQSTASLNRYFSRPQDALFALRRDTDFN